MVMAMLTLETINGSRLIHLTTGILRIVQSTAAPDAIWGWLDCCSELGRYYRLMARYRFGGIYIRLMRPAWGTHVTVVRREVPQMSFESILQWDGTEVEFQYHDLQTNGKHVWLDVDCPSLLAFREKLGLQRIPEFPLHITVGVMPGDI